MSDREFAAVALDRAALYHWFARAFLAPPAASEVVDLHAGPASSLLDALASVPGAGAGVAAMRAVLEAEEPAHVSAAIGAVHARLFYGAGGDDAVAPYRSAHDSEEGLLCGKAAAEMDKVLRQHRLRVDDTVRESADHLSVQLDAMAQLAARSAQAGGTPANVPDALRAEQADFVATQLLSWLGRFARRVTDADALGYHAGLAHALLAVVEQDHQYLTEAAPA